MSEKDILIVIDASTRDMSTYTCAVTQLQDERLVLRKGTTVPLLELEDCDVDMPILVIGSYQAQSSAGFTDTFQGLANRRYVAGGAGFTWENSTGTHGGALRKFSRGTYGIFIPNGGMITRLETNFKNSNPATADAVLVGLRMRAQMSDDVVIVEGQSDYVMAWKISNMPRINERVEFPSEHREDIFKIRPDLQTVEG